MGTKRTNKYLNVTGCNSEKTSIHDTKLCRGRNILSLDSPSNSLLFCFLKKKPFSFPPPHKNVTTQLVCSSMFKQRTAQLRCNCLALVTADRAESATAMAECLQSPSPVQLSSRWQPQGTAGDLWCTQVPAIHVGDLDWVSVTCF